jgi:hypothetical protein
MKLPGQRSRNRHEREPFTIRFVGGVARGAEPEREGQRQAGEQRKIGLGIDAEGGQQGKNLLGENAGGERLLLGVPVGRAQAPDAGGRQGGVEILRQARDLVADHAAHAACDQLQLPAGREPGDVAAPLAGVVQHPQPADTDHEELVQVGGGDGQELEALQQGHAPIERFVEYALVELEPAQFAVDETVGRPVGIRHWIRVLSSTRRGPVRARGHRRLRTSFPSP